MKELVNKIRPLSPLMWMLSLWVLDFTLTDLYYVRKQIESNCSRYDECLLYRTLIIHFFSFLKR